MIYQDKSIGFVAILVPLIIKGVKTLTYRYGNKYDFLSVSDQINIKDSETDNIFAQIEITKKYWTIFKDLSISCEGHEIYSSKEEQRKTFNKYYQREFKDEDKMLVLGFKVIKIY